MIRLDPGLAAPYANRGNAWKAKGDLDRALEDQNEALRRDPKNVVVYANRGDIWRLKGDLERALIEQDQSVRLDPKSPLPFVARGNTYRYKGELNRALADYDQALRLTPDYIPAFVGRGLTFEKAGDVARARAEYNKALNSKSQFRGDNAGSALETARARLAAFDSGAVQPVIPAAPARVTSSTSIPTPEVAVPAPATVEAGKLGRRVALVIGNAGYTNASRLKNPQHDAERHRRFAARDRLRDRDGRQRRHARADDRCAAHVFERGGEGRLGGGLLFRPRHGGERHELSAAGRLQALRHRDASPRRCRSIR